MLTLATFKRAQRLATSYGDTTSHYFDGRNDPRPPDAPLPKNKDAIRIERAGFVRRWIPEKGAYAYIEATEI